MIPKQKYTSFFSTNTVICCNCSTPGHTSKQCPKPITSYGVILFRSPSWNQAAALVRGSSTGLDPVAPGKGPAIEYLLIQRRDSIGFIEILRGKYKLSDTEYIVQQLGGTTLAEREKLLHESFHTLWENVWGPPQEGGHAYRHEKEQARQKLEALRVASPSLQELIALAGPAWATPEWGFPKGRRDMNESEFGCAMREMWEETNIQEKDIAVVRGIEPLEEVFTGSNHVTYLHKYYIGYATHDGNGGVDIEAAAAMNEHIQREIGAIRWCSLEEGLSLIRPENREKRQVLLRTHNLLQTYCPLLLGASPRWTKR